MSGDTGSEQRLRLAIANNAFWCDLVCGLHGGQGLFGEGFWSNPGPSPRGYPNLITLSPGDAEGQIARIAQLDGDLDAGWGVKDSFAALDLAPQGFELAIDGRWVGWNPGPWPADPEVEWLRIASDDGLAAWEVAWRGLGAAARRRIFLDDLLSAEGVAVFAGVKAGRIVAGCIANRAAGAVGLSNLFVIDDQLARLRRGCLGLVSDFGAGLPVVGWEPVDDMADPSQPAHQILGSLRVWSRKG